MHDEDDGGIFYDKFYVRFNHTYPWTMAWKNGLTITGNSQVDSIFSEHQLQVDYYTTIIGHAVYVKAPVVINLPPRI